MAQITLTRPDETMNRFYDYNIFVNGRNAGQLKRGGSQTITTDAPEVTLQARMYWCGSREVQLDTTESSTFEVRANAFFNRMHVAACLIFVTLTSAALLFDYSPTFKYIATGIIAAILIVLIYNISRQRNKWLTLRAV